MQQHYLLEHMLGDGGSITEGKGKGFIPEPIRVIRAIESVESPYRDISSILNWYLYGHNVGYDKLFIRQKMIELYSGNLQDYNSQEKEALLIMDVASPEDLAEEFGVEAAFSAGRTFLEITQEERSHRISVVTMLIRAELGFQYAMGALLPLIDPNYHNLIWLYIEFNVISEASTGITGIVDYFKSTSRFLASGFKESGLVTQPSSSFTILELSNFVAEILEYGTWQNGLKVPGLTP